jgi:hypothetical protein
VELLLRKHLVNWHLYLGLLIAPYVVVYALSAVAINHGMKGAPSTPTSEVRTVTLPAAEDDFALARALSEQLGVRGWINRGRIERPSPEELTFPIGRPGSRVQITVDEASGEARVVTVRSGAVSVLKGLHGLHDLGGTLWGETWAVYTEVSVWVLALAIFSGILLWLPRPSARVVGGSFLTAGAAVTVLLVAWIW